MSATLTSAPPRVAARRRPSAVRRSAWLVVAVVVLAALWPGFARYDARHPQP